ncbi:hypothetical protein RI367_005411 [Sorochytrium milnesiophthora]
MVHGTLEVIGRSPSFCETFYFDIYEGITQVHFDVYDHDQVRSDHIGMVSIDLRPVYQTGSFDQWVTIRTPTTARPAGELHCVIYFRPHNGVAEHQPHMSAAGSNAYPSMPSGQQQASYTGYPPAHQPGPYDAPLGQPYPQQTPYQPSAVIGGQQPTSVGGYPTQAPSYRPQSPYPPPPLSATYADRPYQQQQGLYEPSSQQQYPSAGAGRYYPGSATYPPPPAPATAGGYSHPSTGNTGGAYPPTGYPGDSSTYYPPPR